MSNLELYLKYYRLHPFSLGELAEENNPEVLEHLMLYGGFPEPLLRAEQRFHRRWLREQGSRVIYEDLRDLERVREVSRLELLLQHLPDCVGSPLSVHALSQRLGVAHETMENWISIAEFAVECKAGERAVSPHTRYFRERTGINRMYQVHLGEKDYGSESTDTRVLPFATFCRELKMP